MSTPQYSVPYRSQHVDLDLSRNEGSPAAVDLIRSVIGVDELIRRYPDTTALRHRLAETHGVSSEQVLVTAGGDDALFRCVLARLGPGQTAVAIKPSFEMISVYSEQVGARLVEIEWWEGRFPTADLIDAAGDANAVFLVSPNNPTGSTIIEADLRKVAEAARFVVLDAAYVEFADEDLTGAALDMGNVVVVRTLSKAYGLAGLRVGYLLGPPHLIEEISAYGSPYSISSLSAAIAIERLDRPRDEIAAFVDEVRCERDDLAKLLGALGIPSIPSQGNFLLAEVGDAQWVTDACAALGVGIRRFPDRDSLRDRVRITLPGDPDDFARLEHVLTTVFAPEALLFDLDGVLVDVTGSYRRAIVDTAAFFGVVATHGDIERVKSSGGANDDWELTRRLLADRGVAVDYREVAARFEARYQGNGTEPGLKANERPLVDASVWAGWARTLPLGVVTGRPRVDAEEVLDRFGLLSNTSVLVTREDAPLKPNPAPIRLALQRLAVEHAWMVGDTRDDIEAARSAEVLPIGVAAPGRDPRAMKALTPAARTLDRTHDLGELLP